jgi:DNA mismatch repair protein MutS
MLDYNIGLALMMDLYRLTIPELVDGSCIHIDGGRHIISEQVKHYFVENDFHCTHNVTIVTGPNYSGKSVYLKQVSLIVYLCHCGLPVPARYSKVALFEVMATLFAGETLRTGLLKQTDAELMALE